MDLLYEHTLRRQQLQIEAQKAQIEELRGLVHLALGDSAEMKTAMVPTIPIARHLGQPLAIVGDGNRVMQVVDQSVHTTMNIFGGESMAHIDRIQVKAILDSVMTPAGLLPDAAQQAVVKAAMMVYSDPEKPENLTCYLPNKKTSDALVHGASGWEVQPVQLVAPPMALRGMDVLFDMQPLEDCDRYTDVMRDLRDNEKRYEAGCKEPMKTVLIRNKDLLARVLKRLPLAGEK